MSRRPSWRTHRPGAIYSVESARPRAENEATWQRYVVVLIWLALAILLVAGCGLTYAKAHGFLTPAHAHDTPLPRLLPESP